MTNDVQNMPNPTVLNIAVLAFENCMGSSIHGLLDAFACSNLIAAQMQQDVRFNAYICTLNGKRIWAYNGRPIEPDGDLVLGDNADIIIIPSIMPSSIRSQYIDGFMEPLMPMKPWLLNRAKQGACIASSCTGSFVLAEFGLLDGKTATTHWGAAGAFVGRYPSVVMDSTELVVDNGNILCSGGAVSYLDLAFHLIERFGSRELRIASAKLLVADGQRELQSPFIDLRRVDSHVDAKILEAQLWIEQNFHTECRPDDIAELVGMSGRNLKRRFSAATGVTVTKYVQNLRLSASCDHLASSILSIQEITWKVGYSDVSSFCRLFKKSFGITMNEYRGRFGRSRLAAQS
jgi:transcriptional regulator GlxA family with amidase domain